MPFFFQWPRLLETAFAIAAATCVTGAWRRVSLSRASTAWFTTGLICLAVAAGGLGWKGHHRGDVTVMVDLSPSTRGAAYRQRNWLTKRVQQLLKDTPYQVVYFADRTTDAVSGNPLADLPGNRTRFVTPATNAIVLFSDGQFELAAIAPPTYPVIDPGLEDARDAAVVNVETRPDDEIAIEVRNSGRNELCRSRVRFPRRCR